MNPSEPREIVSALRTDGIALGLALVLAAPFYLAWPLSHDHFVYDYMAWGLTMGLRPYVDLIDMNWPGPILIHSLARAISGSEGWGFRLIDLLLLFRTLLWTSAVLAGYGAGPLLRWTIAIGFAAAYFQGTYVTGQRDGQAMFLVSGAVCWLLLQCRQPSGQPFVVGMIVGAEAGFGLWIKPSIGPVLAIATLIGLFGSRAGKGHGFRSAVGVTVGALLVSVAMVGWLASWGSLVAFRLWAIEYVLGPYAQSRYGLGEMLSKTWNALYENPVPMMLLVAALVSAVFATRRRSDAPTVVGWLAPPLLVAAVALWTAVAQGKGFIYHYVPAYWAIAMAGGLIAAPLDLKLDRPVLGTSLFLLLLMCQQHFVREYRQPVTPERQLAERLEKELEPDESVVIWGFLPETLATLERPTPFPFVGSYGVYAYSAHSEPHVLAIQASLVGALRHPTTSIFVVHRDGWHGPTAPLLEPHEFVERRLREELWSLGFVPERWTVAEEEFDIYRKESR